MSKLILRGALVAIGIGGAMVVGMPVASADPVSNYANLNAGPICSTLDEYPTVAGVTGVLSAVMEESGFPAYQAGQVVALAVAGYCPNHMPEIRRFIAVYTEQAPQTFASSARIGGVLK